MKQQEGGREGGRRGVDQTESLMVSIDPVQGHGGDEGVPALAPYCHLDLGPIRDL